MPKNLPQNTLIIDLSYNQLTALNVSDLTNYIELQELILNNNQIERVVDNSVRFQSFNFSSCLLSKQK